ncbi:hypothetical protein [Sphaerisporangium sp. NPDC051011]|uniref:hypothetical protein n=1 Tax=Sphaerisporangium sp. NPDC051011 TaxID=3155792 RepID=UPI003402551F
MAPALPAQANAHADTNGAHTGLMFRSTPDGGGPSGGEEEVPAVKKPRKEIRKHRPIRHIAYRPQKHYEHFHKPRPEEYVDVSVTPEHGGGGGFRNHHRHHGHRHNGHFIDDLYRARHLRRHHSHQEAYQAALREADRWLNQRPMKHRVKHHDTHRS